ncbi:MAG: RCC1 domain-containing protein [Opitutaceae bacterium]
MQHSQLRGEEGYFLLGMGSADYLEDGEFGFTPNTLGASLIFFDVVSVAAGDDYCMFIRTDGSLWGMGVNDYSQLGDGSTSDHSTPVQVASDVVSVAVGFDHSLFIKSDGSLWAMGANYMGQLGDGTTTDRSDPVQVASDVISVSSSLRHSLFIQEDGSLWAMGWNRYGQLGDGTFENRSTPILVAEDVVSVSAGAVTSLFVKDDGSLWEMGGIGPFESVDPASSIPVEIHGSGVVSASAGAGAGDSLFLKEGGILWAIGYGDPELIANDVVNMAAGRHYSLFVKEGGSMWAMGYDQLGALGDWSNIISGAPIQVASGVKSVVTQPINQSLFLVERSQLLGNVVYFDPGESGAINRGRRSRGEPFQMVLDGESAVAPSITANDGWHFSGWDTDLSVVTSDLMITAQYLREYDVTFAIADAAIRIGGGGLAQEIIYGEPAVAPMLSVGDGWLFDSWDTDFSSVSSDLTINAVFIDSSTTDGDALWDGWEQKYLGGTGVSDGTIDSDGDGNLDEAEFKSGNDPLDATDYFHVMEEAVSPVDGQITLRFTTNDDLGSRRYMILYTDDLETAEPWTELPMGSFAPDPGDSTERSFDAPGAEGAYFFKVEAFIEE